MIFLYQHAIVTSSLDAVYAILDSENCFKQTTRESLPLKVPTDSEPWTLLTGVGQQRGRDIAYLSRIAMSSQFSVFNVHHDYTECLSQH
jgi:hypothetical protein